MDGSGMGCAVTGVQTPKQANVNTTIRHIVMISFCGCYVPILYCSELEWQVADVVMGYKRRGTVEINADTGNPGMVNEHVNPHIRRNAQRPRHKVTDDVTMTNQNFVRLLIRDAQGLGEFIPCLMKTLQTARHRFLCVISGCAMPGDDVRGQRRDALAEQVTAMTAYLGEYLPDNLGRLDGAFNGAVVDRIDLLQLQGLRRQLNLRDAFIG